MGFLPISLSFSAALFAKSYGFVCIWVYDFLFSLTASRLPNRQSCNMLGKMVDLWLSLSPLSINTIRAVSVTSLADPLSKQVQGVKTSHAMLKFIS